MDKLEVATFLSNFHLTSMFSSGRTERDGIKPLPSDHPNSDSFLCALREILSNAAYRSVVSWLPEGKIWRIHDVMDFQARVLPLTLTFRKIDYRLDLFVACTRAHGFQELSRGPNSIAFYSKAFFREVSRHPSVPPKEIHFPSLVHIPAITAENSKSKVKLRTKDNVPFKPLAPPPFDLPNRKKPSTAPRAVLSSDMSCDASISYCVDSVRGLSLVKLVRENEIVDKPAGKPTRVPSSGETLMSVQSKVSKHNVVKAKSGEKKAKKPRKK